MRCPPSRRSTTTLAATGVATIALNQPETRNALSPQLLTELIAALEQARDDDAGARRGPCFDARQPCSRAAATSPPSPPTPHRRQARAERALSRTRVRVARRARQAVDLRRRRPCAGRRARVGARLRPDDREAERALRDCRRSTSGCSRSWSRRCSTATSRARRRPNCCCSASRSPPTDAERIGLVNQVVADDEFDHGRRRLGAQARRPSRR